MNMRASRKGLSPLLAIIIGLVVTVVAGILLAQLYFSYAATISARPAANVEYVDLVVATSGGGTLTLNIKNMGGQPINGISVRDPAGNNLNCYPNAFNVPPGGTTGIACSVTGVNSGQTWNGYVEVSFTDQSTQIYAISVRARSA
jgi:hypothetical protein